LKLLTEKHTNKPLELKRIYTISFIPIVLVLLLWLTKISEVVLDVSWSEFGIFPRTIEGLRGILLAPFLHADFSHLISNSLPLIFLSLAIFYFYKEVALKAFVGIFILTHLSVWLAARPSFHIGASGLVYGFASFLFFSGIIRKYYRLMAISLLVIFLYGGMVWGVFPLVKNMSWESHLYGMFWGYIFAYYYREYGPQKPTYDWINDDNDDEIPEPLDICHQDEFKEKQ